jgi:hypothetical protein
LLVLALSGLAVAPICRSKRRGQRRGLRRGYYLSARLICSGGHVRLVRLAPPYELTRSDGAIVIVCGLTAVVPMPGLSGVGPMMAAARNYIFTLNAEVAPKASTPARRTSARLSRTRQDFAP